MECMVETISRRLQKQQSAHLRTVVAEPRPRDHEIVQVTGATWWFHFFKGILDIGPESKFLLDIINTQSTKT